MIYHDMEFLLSPIPPLGQIKFGESTSYNSTIGKLAIGPTTYVA